MKPVGPYLMPLFQWPLVRIRAEVPLFPLVVDISDVSIWCHADGRHRSFIAHGIIATGARVSSAHESSALKAFASLVLDCQHHMREALS